MPVLNEQNSTVDKKSGAVIFHKSPELLEIVKLNKKVDDLNDKLNEVLKLLKGGDDNGKEMD